MTDNILVQQASILEMPEWKRVANIRQFSLSLQIFRGNAHQLINLLGAPASEGAAQGLWSMQNRPELNLFQVEVARLLHNFVASAFSLVDHARRFYGMTYKDQGSFVDYEGEVRVRFADIPVCQFVQGLRNFFVHKHVPTITSRLTANAGSEPLHQSLLKKAEILDFDWKGRAREFLSAAPDEIELIILCRDYYQRVTDFYDWVFARLSQIHSGDLAAIEAKRRDLVLELAKHFPGHLEHGLRIIQQIPMDPEQIFLPCMSPEEWRTICEGHSDPVERANALLDAVAALAPLSEELRRRVVEAFRSAQP